MKKKDDFSEKIHRWSNQIAEEKKREKKEKKERLKWFLFIPKHATFWREVMEATNGKGIRPYLYGRELEEYKENVPRCLKRKKGYAPDDVAKTLELEGGDQALYEKLDQDRRRPVEDIPEHIQDRENDRIKEIERSRKQPTYVHLEVEELSVEEMYRRLIKYHEPKAAQIKVRVEGPDDVYDIAAIIKAKVEKLNKATQSND